MFFLWIPDIDIALARIKERVADGGHNIPAKDVKRRFSRSLSNFFKLYKPILTSWVLFDNSSSIPEIIAEENNGKLLITNQRIYNKILKSKGVGL